MYQSVAPVYTRTQSGYMLATSQPDCYVKTATRNASDNVDIINNDDKQENMENMEKRMNKIESSLMQLINLFQGQQPLKGEEKEAEKPKKKFF